MKSQLLFISLFIVALAGCKAKTTTTQSALGSVTSGCLIGKWSNAYLPLQLKMSSDFPEVEVDGNGLNNFEQMAKAWNDASTRTLITVPFVGQTSNLGYASTSAYQDGEIGIYKSSNWFSGVSSGALAITQFYGTVASSPSLGQYIELTHADIIFNYRYFGSQFTLTNNPTVNYDLPTVLLHEMGHLLGLCHESSRSSVMAPYYLTVRRSLEPFDTDIIKDLYVDGFISNLNASGGIKKSAISSPVGTEVKGIIELRKDGECIHRVEGKEIYRHLIELKKKK